MGEESFPIPGTVFSPLCFVFRCTICFAESNHMNILLLFPPHWDLESVYPSLPTLTSFLRYNGHDVVQRDINIELYDLMLSKSHLLQVASAIPKEIKRMEKGKPRSRVNAGKLKALRVASVLLEMVLDDVEVAKAELRRPDLEIDRGVRNQAILQIARKIISSPFYPASFAFGPTSPDTRRTRSQGYFQVPVTGQRISMLQFSQRE